MEEQMETIQQLELFCYSKNIIPYTANIVNKKMHNYVKKYLHPCDLVYNI